MNGEKTVSPIHDMKSPGHHSVFILWLFDCFVFSWAGFQTFLI